MRGSRQNKNLRHGLAHIWPPPKRQRSRSGHPRATLRGSISVHVAFSAHANRNRNSPLSDSDSYLLVVSIGSAVFWQQTNTAFSSAFVVRAFSLQRPNKCASKILETRRP